MNMDYNKVKIISFGKKCDILELNGKRLDFISDYRITKQPNELSTITITLDCDEIEVIPVVMDKPISEMTTIERRWMNGKIERFEL
jgi:hypothetical protein